LSDTLDKSKRSEHRRHFLSDQYRPFSIPNPRFEKKLPRLKSILKK